MGRIFTLTALLWLGLASLGIASAQDSAAKLDLAGTGKLRVAVAVSPAPSALWVIPGDQPGTYRGVAIDLGRLLATRLGVPVIYVPYKSSGDITRDADNNTWDVTFLPVDEERKKRVAFGPAYHLLQSTYAVSPTAKIETVAQANSSSVRIGGIADTTTFRASAAASANAKHIAVTSVDEAIALMKSGGIDAIALSRESLGGLSGALPGLRVLDGGFFNSTTAIAVPNGRDSGLAYVSGFIEEAKAAGEVRAAFDRVGLTSSVVAPAGLKP